MRKPIRFDALRLGQADTYMNAVAMVEWRRKKKLYKVPICIFNFYEEQLPTSVSVCVSGYVGLAYDFFFVIQSVCPLLCTLTFATLSMHSRDSVNETTRNIQWKQDLFAKFYLNQLLLINCEKTTGLRCCSINVGKNVYMLRKTSNDGWK